MKGKKRCRLPLPIARKLKALSFEIVERGEKVHWSPLPTTRKLKVPNSKIVERGERMRRSPLLVVGKLWALSSNIVERGERCVNHHVTNNYENLEEKKVKKKERVEKTNVDCHR